MGHQLPSPNPVGRSRLFSIANQLRYGLIATVISSVLLTGSGLTYLSFRYQLQQIQFLQQERAQAASTKISAYLDTLQRQLNYLSELRGFTEFNPTTQYSLLDGLVNSNSAYEVVGILNADGTVEQALSPYEPIAPDSLDLSTLSTDPTVLANLLSGQNYVSPVEIDSEIGLPVATLAVPIRNGQNEIAGILFAKINLNFLEQIILRTEVGETGYSYVLDDRSVLIAQKDNSAASLQLSDLSDRPLMQSLSQLSQGNDIQPTQIYTGLQGKRVIGAANLVRRVQWLVVVELPTTETYAPVRYMLQLMGGATLIGAIAAAAVGIVFSRSLTIPLKRLAEAATRMSSGQFDSRVNIVAANELGDLAQSFNQMAGQLDTAFKALETANTELEHRVEQRTLELQAANHEITHLNKQLQAENRRLGTELDVARKLQHMILPKAKELEQIPGLDVAAFMEPADEVGGDYYDVLQHDGTIKIGIGDVTGHGLESGMVMLMVQTAVRTLLTIDEKDPKRFFNVLNRIVYDNVRRMQSHKNMTLALLDYRDGLLSLSGQHEETIVIRADGYVEKIDTFDLGFPIGLEPDITAFVEQAHVQLCPGDVVVLYSDGVTEAENDLRRQYGLERLCQVASTNRHQTATEIRQAIIHDLQCHIGNHKVYDDITLLVLKQK